MTGLIVSFFVSFFICILIIRTQSEHGHLSADHDLSGPQKFHTRVVPRIGGIGIALGIVVAVQFRDDGSDKLSFYRLFLVCALPAFLVGLLEDFTKRAGISIRALVIAIGALLFCVWFNAGITHLDIPIVDGFLLLPYVSVVFTVFAITGLANAFNIIDGFNGLSSMVGIIALSALGYLGVVLHDSPMAYLAFAFVGAIVGFFVWNYPKGLIFLGDGGAYLIGFWIAALSILMVGRHHEVSPWFALMINGYPILETLFTIYRRWIHQGKNPGHPDGIHFHSLIYRRILKTQVALDDCEFMNANARTSPYLWFLSCLSVVPAILWWQNTGILMICALLFTVFYVWLYSRIVRFKTPSWMHP